MNRILPALVLACLFAGVTTAQELPTNLDVFPKTYGLPDLFTFDDGTPVKDLEDWNRRRAELIAPLMFYQYGRMPPRPDQVTARVDNQKKHDSGLGTETWLTLIIDSQKQLEMRIVVYSPNQSGRHPAIIEEEGSLGGSKNARMFLEKNYLFIEYARHDLDPDKNNTIGPAQKAYPEYDWATLAVWAWGGQRVVDYLETRDDVDMKYIAITGHSRGGKQALLAAALDKRIMLAVPNGSGAGGAGASRVMGPGAESIRMNDKPWWYHERIQIFGENEAHLPFDQHFLKALMAPRGLYCIESTDDLFANPEGTFATSAAAMPVYELYGKPERNAITFRHGGHTFSTEDWKSLLEFAELTFFDRRVADEKIFWQQPASVTPATGSGGQSKFVSVGDPGNDADVHYPRVGSFGSVEDTFEIGQYKVRNSEYATFLNAIAGESDVHGLYHPLMRIRRGGVRGSYMYTAYPATEQAAVTYVSWHDALRYCNWLHAGDSETGAYDLSGLTSAGSRRPTALYFLPTEDEWYKACYYDPEKKEFRLHPLRNAHREHADRTPPTKSSYGMLETADPIWEWTESEVGELFRGLRSDSWFQGNNRQAQGRFYINPELELGHIGFRVAKSSLADLETQLIVALQAKDYESAENLLIKQVAKRPGNGDIRFRLAMVQNNLGKTKETLAAMKRLVATKRHVEAARWIVREKYDKRKWSKLSQSERVEFGSLAKLLYQELRDDAEVQNLYADYLIASGDLARALPILRDLSDDNPLRGLQAAAVARRLRLFDEANAIAERSLEALNAMSDNEPLNLAASLAVAQNQMFLERFTEAIRTLDKAINLAKTPEDRQLARQAFGDAVVAFIKHTEDNSDGTVAKRVKILKMLQIAVQTAPDNPRVKAVIFQQLRATRDNDNEQITALREALSKTMESADAKIP